jgi:hypothetical protein
MCWSLVRKFFREGWQAVQEGYREGRRKRRLVRAIRDYGEAVSRREK